MEDNERPNLMDTMRYRALQALKAYQEKSSVEPTNLGIVATVLDAAFSTMSKELRNYGLPIASEPATFGKPKDEIERLRKDVYRFEEDCAAHLDVEANLRSEIERLKTVTDETVRKAAVIHGEHLYGGSNHQPNECSMSVLRPR